MAGEQKDAVVISVPWPARLFGDLQYFLGLPAITIALDLRTAVSATPRGDDLFTLKAPWMPGPASVDRARAAEPLAEIPAFARAVRALQAAKISLPGGHDFQIVTRAPWVEALPDSPALAVAGVVSLLAAQDRIEEFSGADVAEIVAGAFQGEEPSARWTPEILTGVLGGTLYVEPGQSPKPIERQLPGLLIGYAGRAPSEAPRQADAVRQTLVALGQATAVHPDFSLRDTGLDDVTPRLRELSDPDAGTVYAHLRSRDLTRGAYELLEGEYGFDDDQFGELLDDQHEMLREYLGYHVPDVEKLIQAAAGAGAIGSKLLPNTNGFFTFAPGREDAVLAAIRSAGGQAQPTEVTDGMRIEALRASK